MKQVESYFKSYPNDECFTTSDGMVFHKKGDANLHATSLDDKEVTPHKRSKYLSPKKEEVKEPKAPKEPKQPKKDAADPGAGTGTPE